MPIFANKGAADTVEPFGHHPELKWVRGIVTREPQDGTWGIVYDDTPAEEDRFAGHLSLAPSPELERLRDGDIVEIQGKVDTIVHDRLGKPVYVVADLKKMATMMP